MKLKFGIIGFGKIGQLRKKIIEELEIGEVIAIADPNINSFKIDNSIELLTDYHKLLKLDIDAVIIATPNFITSQAVIDSLLAGKHVFSEKPPGRNLNEVKEIEKVYSKTKNLVLKFGFNHREHFSVREAKKIIHNNVLGEIMWARGFYGKSGGENFENEWRSDKELAGGGILLDQGIHMIDLLNYFIGDFVEVKSFVTRSFWNIGLEDNAFAIMKNKQNKFAVFHSSSTQWKHLFRLELFFENGYMILSGLLTGSLSYGTETLIIAKRNFSDKGQPNEEELFFDEDKSWYFELNDFYNCIENNSQVIQGSIYDALKAMELIEKIYENKSF